MKQPTQTPGRAGIGKEYRLQMLAAGCAWNRVRMKWINPDPLREEVTVRRKLFSFSVGSANKPSALS